MYLCRLEIHARLNGSNIAIPKTVFCKRDIKPIEKPLGICHLIDNRIVLRCRNHLILGSDTFKHDRRGERIGGRFFCTRSFAVIKDANKKYSYNQPAKRQARDEYLGFRQNSPEFRFQRPHAFLHLIHPLFLSKSLLFKKLPWVIPHALIVVFSMSLDEGSCLQSEIIHIRSQHLLFNNWHKTGRSTIHCRLTRPFRAELIYLHRSWKQMRQRAQRQHRTLPRT